MTLTPDDIEPMLMSLTPGVNWKLEDQADALLAEGRRGVTSMAAKTDYLSREQLALRQSKEVFNTNGVPDSSLVAGLYRRAYNPLSGQRPKHRKSDD
jgi:hypothetical protein